MSAYFHDHTEIQLYNDVKLPCEKSPEKQDPQETEEKRDEGTSDKDRNGGKIYGTDYLCYSEEDIKNITDVEFLQTMFCGILPRAQPKFMWEIKMYCDLQRAISDRIDELVK